MNALTKQPAPAAPMLAPALVPANMSEAIKLAEIMASAKLVPVGLQKSVADCLMVVQQAVRWQMDPFAVAQECRVIQGKLMHSGKLVAAVVNSRGNLTQRLSFEYGGEGQNRTITVSGQLQGEAAPRTVKVVLRNAVNQQQGVADPARSAIDVSRRSRVGAPAYTRADARGLEPGRVCRCGGGNRQWHLRA